MMKQKIPPQIEFALSRLYNNGYEAYLVGGAPRDILLNRTPHDYDIATSATTEQIKSCFKGSRLLDLGSAYGTITLLKDGMEIEITTYRRDLSYLDHRHPDVEFSDCLTEDLKRRDFTVNAIAYLPPSLWVDPYGGKEDLKNKIIRCVGDPKERFCEDPLRILRAFRFGSVLGFSLEKETLKVARENAKLLRYVSKERIFQEFKRLLCGENAAEMLKEGSLLWSEIFGRNAPLNPPLESLCKAPLDPAVRFALYFIEKTPGEAEEALRNIKADNKLISLVNTLLINKESCRYHNMPDFKRLYGSLKKEETGLLLSFWQSLNQDIKWFEGQIKEIKDKSLCCNIKKLNINGKDLQDLGFPSGKEIGQILDDVLENVISERLVNERCVLLSYVKEHYCINR